MEETNTTTENIEESGIVELLEEPEQEQEQIEDPVVQEQEQQYQEEVPVEDPSYNEFYSEQLELTNHLLAGQIFFLGVIFGVLLFKVFWDRWKV